jgi:cysteine desulfurase/selenocysteine lyase
VGAKQGSDDDVGVSMMNMKIQHAHAWKKDFPIFRNHPSLVYLDNAATSQRPQQVIDALTSFMERDNANIHRGVYTLSEETTQKYEEARKKVAAFVHAAPEEIVFTKNTTESINLIAYTIHSLLPEGKNEIVVSEMEHHSNLLPWQQLCKRVGMKLKFIPVTKSFELDYKKAEEIITEKTALVAVTHVSNVFGTVNDIKKIVFLAKKNNALSVIDGAQSVAHLPIDVKDVDCDFFVFSSHKMVGPTGIGVLYGRKNLLKKLPPFLCGGGMIEKVDYESATFAQTPEKFEAGTPPIAEAIALGAAVDYLEHIGMEVLKNYQKELLDYALNELARIEGIIIYNPGIEKSASIISFNLKDIHPHDVAEILNNDDIAIRAGHHCCMPLMKQLGISGTCRVSLSFYNTKEDIDRLISGLRKVREVFHV